MAYDWLGGGLPIVLCSRTVFAAIALLVVLEEEDVKKGSKERLK